MKFRNGDQIEVTIKGTVAGSDESFVSIDTPNDYYVYIEADLDNDIGITVKTTRSLPEADGSIVEFSEMVAIKALERWQCVPGSGYFYSDEEILELIGEDEFTVIREGK